MAQLAMHSPYETAGANDTAYLVQFAKTFYETTLVRTCLLYTSNKVVDPAFVKKHGDLASVLAVTIEELTYGIKTGYPTLRTWSLGLNLTF